MGGFFVFKVLIFFLKLFDCGDVGLLIWFDIFKYMVFDFWIWVGWINCFCWCIGVMVVGVDGVLVMFVFLFLLVLELNFCLRFWIVLIFIFWSLLILFFSFESCMGFFFVFKFDNVCGG